jgi:hypothetical protein
MPKNYILVDFENVQPTNLSLLNEVDESVAEFNVLVFVGAKQATISFDFAADIQNMGAKAEYVKCSVTQKNAADFLLSYHLGRLIHDQPDAYFHIISKDKGFDSLVTHLREQKHKVYRHDDISEIYMVSKYTKPVIVSPAKVVINHADNVIVNLKGRGSSKPRKVKTLKSTIANLIKGDTDASAEKVFNTLVWGKVVIVDGEKVSYNL